VVDGAGVLLELEPRQQSDSLRVIDEVANRNRSRGIGKNFDDVADFEKILALVAGLRRSTGPERSDVVNPIVTDEGIIEDLGLRRSRSE
jgi:hypothetical protein